ncbi:MAG: sugar ABC transporter ATP-binding protein [Marinilabiliales bacterium]|nr:MAG: sugar ABC transporter ATP-binding protein [Marinilabiliales bacterium]
MENSESTAIPVLEARNISKEFSGNYALIDVNLKVYPGKVNALVGENGAGKSTLMKIFAGVYTGYTGEVLYREEMVSFRSTAEAQASGIAIIHQELNLVHNMTVAENIFLGREPLTRIGLTDYRKMHEVAAELMRRLHLDVDPGTPVYQLRTGQQQLVEIARALHFDSRVLIMDEPTSSLSESETALLFRIIRGLKEKGVAIIYISHKIDELLDIADNFTALKDGRVTGSMDITRNIVSDDIIRMMVGRDIMMRERRAGAANGHVDGREAGKELLRVSNLVFRNPRLKPEFLVNDVSFSLDRGEILGVSGLMGAGRTEMLEAIFGLHCKYVSGNISVEGSPVRINSVQDAIRAGMALVPEDRQLQGLIMEMDVAANTTLVSLKKVLSLGFIDRKKEMQLCRRFREKLNIRLASFEQEVATLSGGNQQKVVIAKWLAAGPKILLLDEPTRGVDIGAKQEIYNIIEELAAGGMGIILVSSELPEILSLCDRILVFSSSRLTATLTREEATEEVIMKAATANL